MKDIYSQLREAVGIQLPAVAATDLTSSGSVTEEKESISNFVDNVISGKITGFSTWNNLGKLVGRIERGHLITVGGYSGSGKSFFMLNMCEELIGNAEPAKVAIFSTELSRYDYVKRLMFMRMGVYETYFKSNPQALIVDNKTGTKHTMAEYVKEQQDVLFNDIRLEDGTLRIWGDVLTVEQIEKVLEKLKEDGTLPDVVMVDWVQQLSIGKVSLEREAMPLIAKKIKQLAVDYGVAIVVIAQLNNYAQSKDFKLDSSVLPPFSYGKELNQVSDLSIVLDRKKEGNYYSKHLSAKVVKARHGTLGIAHFEILDGFQLAEIQSVRASELDADLHNKAQADGYV